VDPVWRPHNEIKIEKIGIIEYCKDGTLGETKTPAYRNNGMLEYWVKQEAWNNGTLEYWVNRRNGKNRKKEMPFVLFFSFNPMFHYSNIPVFQCSSVIPLFHFSVFYSSSAESGTISIPFSRILGIIFLRDLMVAACG
jgi:hypothetical protein